MGVDFYTEVFTYFSTVCTGGFLLGIFLAIVRPFVIMFLRALSSLL